MNSEKGKTLPTDPGWAPVRVDMSFGIRPPASQAPPTRHVVPSPFTVPRIEKTEKHVEKETPKRPTENHEKRKAKNTKTLRSPQDRPLRLNQPGVRTVADHSSRLIWHARNRAAEIGLPVETRPKSCASGANSTQQIRREAVP